MQTQLIYTVIIRKRKTVLCEFTESSGSFSLIVKRLLEKLNKIEQTQFRVGFTLENYMFYCLLIDNIYIITMMTITPLTSNINDLLFAFLYKIHSTVLSSVDADKLKKAPAYSLDEGVNIFKDNMNLFNQNLKEHFNDFVGKANKIPIEDSLNNQVFDTGNPFAILTKSQIHENQPNEFEKSEIRETSMIQFGNPDTEKTFLREEFYFNETDEGYTQSNFKKNKWIYISILAVVLIIAVILLILFGL